MSLDIKIKGGRGEGKLAGVTESRGLQVAQVVPDVLPVGSKSRYRFYSAILGNTGANSGTLNMNVNGSVTPQEFYIASNKDFDLYITDVSIIIADSAVTHGNFGAVAPLTNGWDLKISEAGEIIYIVEKAKTGGQVIAYSGFSNPFGTGTESWELLNWTGTQDAQVVLISLRNWIPGGLRLGRGTVDRFSSIINDNLTGLDEFTVRVFGYRHYPV